MTILNSLIWSKSPFGLKVLFGTSGEVHKVSAYALSKSPFGLKVLFGYEALWKKEPKIKIKV